MDSKRFPDVRPSGCSYRFIGSFLVQSKVPRSRSSAAFFHPALSALALKFKPSGEWRVMPSNSCRRLG